MSPEVLSRFQLSEIKYSNLNDINCYTRDKLIELNAHHNTTELIHIDYHQCNNS